MPAPFNEQFNDAYLQKGLQPSVGSVQPIREKPQNNQSGIRNVQVTKKATGAALQAGGASMQAAGKTAKVAGKASMRAGSALSSTGVGAIVGVPLMAIGGVATGAGTAADAAGKQMRRAGKRMGRTKKKASISLSGKFSSHMKVIMVGLTLSLPITFFTLFEMGFFLAAGALQAVGQGVAKVIEDDNVVSNVLEFIVDGVAYVAGSAAEAVKLAASKIGVDFDIGAILTTITDTLNPATYFVAFWVLAMSWGFITLLVVWGIYFFSGEKPLSDPGVGAKKMALLGAMIMYCLPMVHLFPWFLLWVYAIKRNSN